MVIRYVSFDVYDTLIKRMIPCSKMYELMQKKLDKDPSIVIKEFAGKRMQAEKEIQKVRKAYTLEDIYDSRLFAEYDKAQKDHMIALEEEMEIENTIPVYYGKKLYEEFSQSYEIVSVSDMYLCSRVIKMILQKNGYSISKVYISGEYGETKRDKGLFAVVLQDLKINGKELLHIGDAKRSDYMNPKMLGIRSRYIKKIKELVKTGDFYFDFGFNVLGPVIYEFCLWIHENVNRQKLVFMAREGEFLQEVYKILFSDKSEVLYISRIAVVRGTAYTLIRSEGMQKFISGIMSVGLERHVTLENIFQRLGIEKGRYEERARKAGLDFKNVISKATNGNAEIDTRILDFLESIQYELLEELEEGSFMFDQYVRRLNEPVTLVDIGWRGTMQHMLEQYMSAKGYSAEINGLYLGIMNSRHDEHYKGFLFEQEDKTCRSILNFSGLLEILMMPEHGSVSGYALKKDKAEIVPVFHPSEFEKQEYKIIKSVQNGVKDLVRRLSVYDANHCFKQEKYLKQLVRVGCSPRMEEVKRFSELSFFENGKVVRLVEDVSIMDIFDFGFMKQAFQNCKWKVAFLKKVFRVRLPYNTVLNLTRQILN